VYGLCEACHDPVEPERLQRVLRIAVVGRIRRGDVPRLARAGDRHNPEVVVGGRCGLRVVIRDETSSALSGEKSYCNGPLN
jgi:hypothetical protein